MSNIQKAQVEQALASYTDPYLKQDLLSAGAVKSIEVTDGKVALTIELGFPSIGYQQTLMESINAALQEIAGLAEVNVAISSKIVSHSVQRGTTPLPGVKNIIAVASGKGGVGKSTTSVNLALALQKEGAKVGILDADIYGPSQQQMLGVNGVRPEMRDQKTIMPIEAHGIKMVSMGNLVTKGTPMIWRGPMVTQALEQLLNDTNWTDVDYLIIDLRAHYHFFSNYSSQYTSHYFFWTVRKPHLPILFFSKYF